MMYIPTNNVGWLMDNERRISKIFSGILNLKRKIIRIFKFQLFFNNFVGYIYITCYLATIMSIK